ncbi:hypothetical protein ACTJKJ_14080 [Roseateles sp. 22389]|uniref:hypothetical protein n=1 Tax=Roseateles sp. 22389 TaxID=3453916 RepID=UPI003F87B452
MTKAQDGSSLLLSSNVDVNPLVRSLRNRAKWPWVRDYLKANDIKPGGGWTDLAVSSSELGQKGQQLRALLETYFSAIRTGGLKYVQVFELDAALLSAVSSQLAGALVTKSAFSSTYPYTLPEGQLRSASNQLTLCEIIPTSRGDFVLVFCSRKDYTEKEVFSDSAAVLIGNQVPTLEGFTTIVGLRRRSFQAYDLAIVRPSLGRIEIAVDMPLSHATDFNKVEQALRVGAAIETHVSSLHGFFAGNTALNLFPAIAEIYGNINAGKIAELHLRTSTGLVDVLRTTLPDDDLRNNPYHTDAAKAVKNQVELFDVTTRLMLAFPQTETTVRLKSFVAELANKEDHRFLAGVDFLDSSSEHDLLRAINKLTSYL